ncbi:hypothetical protein [Flavobacterium sp. TBRC 19031]|uniref:hypothetical protein n=1 Tax=Flavobacterium mekongense TaxID=3379707 RepID=UPI00399A114B
MTKTEILESIDSFIEKISLTPPEASEHLLHLYADYVELMSLFSRDIIFTVAEVLDRFKDSGIINQAKDLSQQSKQNDENEKWVNQIFQLIEDRAFNYKEMYPFVYKNRSIILKDKLSNKEKIYIHLLFGSNLNIFGKYYGNITTDFEEISYQALVNYLPKKAIVKSFGKNSMYKGYAVDKIRQLANDINIEVNEEGLARISPIGTMERGLDVIGLLPFDDWVGNKLVILAQCACGKKWYDKQAEPKRYDNYLKFYRIESRSALFIPYAIIDFQKRGFHQGDEIINVLIFERKRILDYLDDLSFFDSILSKIIIDKCLERKPDVV